MLLLFFVSGTNPNPPLILTPTVLGTFTLNATTAGTLTLTPITPGSLTLTPN